MLFPELNFFNHNKSHLDEDSTSSDDWALDKVRFDKFHHEVSTRNQNELKKRGALKANKRVKLAIPNSWHSMETTRGLGKLWSNLGFFGFFLSYIGLAIIWYIYPQAVETLDLFALIIAISLVFAYAFFALAQTNLQKIKGIDFFKEEKHILSDQKLRILWNLSGTDPALKIRQKIQDPFNQDTSGFFWDTFFDIKDERTIITELKAIQERTRDIFSFFIGIFAVCMALVGFYIGGFWEHSRLILETSDYGWIIAFLVIFGITLISFLIYSVKLNPKPFILLMIISAIVAAIDEAIFTFVNFWTYLDGEPISLLFAVFGWPVFFILIIGFSNWILKYIRLPEYEGGIGSRILNSIPMLLLIAIFGVLFVLEGVLDEFLTFDQTNMALIAGLIAISILFSLIFGFIHTFKQNLVVVMFAMILGGTMEIMGALCGFWTYFTFSPLIPELSFVIVPNFLIVFWAFRVCSILFVGRILKQKIIRAD